MLTMAGPVFHFLGQAAERGIGSLAALFGTMSASDQIPKLTISMCCCRLDRVKHSTGTSDYDGLGPVSRSSPEIKTRLTARLPRRAQLVMQA